MHQPLAMDKIIESCLILMVLLLLSCARHLIVDCTASVTHISHHHFQLRPLVGALCQIYFPSPSVPFHLSSKCHLVCYKSCNSSLWLQVVAFCAETRPTPREKNKIKHLNVMESWGWSPFGCYLTFCRPPPSRQMSCIHPFVHPSISWSSVTLQDWKSLQSGLLEEAMVTKRTVVLWRRCFGWRH